jgi:hypothetical protein
MKLPPPEVLATWPVPNYIDPEVRGPGLIITQIVLLSIAMIFIAARLYTRIVLVRSFGMDDVLIVVALPPAIALAAISIIANLKYGWNRHVWDLPLDDISIGKKFAMITQVLAAFTANATRWSVVWFLRRLFKGTGSWISPTLDGLLVFITLMWPLFIFLDIFQCQ